VLVGSKLTLFSVSLGLLLEFVKRLVVLLFDFHLDLGQLDLVFVLRLIDLVLKLAALVAPLEELKLRFDLVV
jgi:hypothetical protein